MAVHMRLFGLLLLLLSGVVAAEILPDPTRPPSGPLVESQSGAGGESGAPRLQSVLMPQQGKPTAIIDGQVVPLGGKVGDGRLARLSETEAVIVGSQGVQHLRLTPEAEKVMVSQKSSKKTSGKKKETS